MRRRRPRRLARRLLLAHVTVVLSGVVTFAVVASVLGPRVFLGRVTAASPRQLPTELQDTLVEAFAATMTSSLGIAVAVSVLAAVVVSGLLAVRIARPVEGLAAAARDIERGHSEARVPVPGADDELLDLTTAFNAMASRIEHTELARRRLLDDLAHELRTPLSTLEGYLEGLRDGVLQPDPATLATLTEATMRLHRLVDDIGDASRTAEGELDLHPQTLDLVAVVEAVVEAARPACTPSGIALVLETPEAAVHVRADPDRLAQIVTNLVTNARVHGGADATITVSVEAMPERVCVAVADDGDGIAAQDLPHVFDRFYRAQRSRRLAGSGLGLTIARSLARAHGGDLEASSPGPGRGATFRLTLPRPDP